MISQGNTNYKIRFSDIADEDINRAVEYYSLKSESAVISFKLQLNLALESLEINPFFQFRYKKIRALPFKSLPFIIFFEIDELEKTIFIYSVFNTNQNPNKYPK